ncbi:hypothetical protein PHYPSEUDO_013780 [Phytophthora pseudosyringae]|uniref:WLGC domain-containing protein n=1 Tax=Phytophthora pseudosyringae TaxID=221518 RepID=A0A8T1V5J4_9STRA|nr:hypothetical protein PHYPSEUDO_013780 [Phytophthora pseudosyringae]
MEKDGVTRAEDEEGREIYPIESEDPLHRKPLLANPSTASSKRVYPAGAETELATTSAVLEKKPRAETELATTSAVLEKKPSKYTKALAHAKLPPHGGSHVLLPVGIALAVCICVAWTLWLLLLNVAPNDTVNKVMDTETFDYGSFWLMIKPSTALVALTTVGLSLVALGYLAVLIKMLLTCRRGSKHAYVVKNSGKSVHFVQKMLDDPARKQSQGKIVSTAAQVASSLVDEDSSARKHIKLAMKFGDLALETVLLYQMLESGSPAPLIGIFTVVVASNALTCAAMMFVPYEKAPLAETLIDILFDFLIIVGCPMLVLLYCLSTFSFDRAKFAINLEVFPVGWFEQGASVTADPVETAVIYKSLKSLRIMSAVDFVTRMGVNFTLCYRLRRVVELIHDPREQQSSVYPKRHGLSVGVFVLFAVFLVVFVEESMRTSDVACQPHPECVVKARRWTRLKTDSLTQCPCLMLIDRDVAPKTFAEWETPPNVTEKVAHLATTGDLQTLQLTNRNLPLLPEELRRCTNLRHLSLEYTHTQTFPEWISELKLLEFLHVESKFTSPVVVLPDGMFDEMSSLTFMHLAAFIPMKTLPSLWGLTNLKSLTLAVFLLLEEVPDFGHLRNLERLVLASMPAMESLPDFSYATHLKSFATGDRGAWCCNGFLGDCNLDDGKCGVHPVWGTPAASCLASDRTDKIATEATLAAVRKFSATTCGPVLQLGVLEGPPTPDIMAPCNGTMYRQCPSDANVESMCYNARLMAIACTTNSFPIEMRRRQIAQGVGDVCDPEVEAWLGCK